VNTPNNICEKKEVAPNLSIWVKRATREQRLDCVLNADLDPRQKLYVSVSLILNVVLNDLCLKPVERKDSESLLKEALERYVNTRDLTDFENSVIQHARENLHEGLLNAQQLGKYDDALVGFIISGATSFGGSKQALIWGAQSKHYQGSITAASVANVLNGRMELHIKDSTVLGADSLFFDNGRVSYTDSGKGNDLTSVFMFRPAEEVEALPPAGCPVKHAGKTGKVAGEMTRQVNERLRN